MFNRVLGVVVILVSSGSLYAAQETRFDSEKVRQLRGNNVRVGGRVTIDAVPVAETVETMELERFEVWARDAELIVEGEGGVRTRIATPAVKYYRGSLAGDPDSWVFLAVRDDGAMDGLIARSDRRFSMRSGIVRGPRGEVRHEGLLVKELDLVDEIPLEGETGQGFDCELEGKSIGLAQQLEAATAEGKVTANGTLSGTATYTLNMAIETDYEMYVKFGNNAAAATNIAAWIGNLVGAASVIYRRDLRTDLVVTFSRIPTTSSDAFTVNPGSSGPWNGSPSVTYSTSHALAELGDIWHNAATRPYNGPRSSVVLLSGKAQTAGVAWTSRACQGDFACSSGNCGSAIFDGHWGGGYAYVGGVGVASGAVPNPDATVNGIQYGLPSSNYWSLLGFAHELGHNVAGPHTHCVALTAAEQTQYNVPGRPYIDVCVTASGCNSGATSVPPEKGTIMSYCHNTFSGGFPQSRFTFGRSTEPSQKMVNLITNYINSVTPNSPAISAPASVNAGAAGTASIVSPVAGYTYTWSVSAGTINGSNTGTSVNFTAPGSGSMEVRVRATNASGCAATDYVTVAVNAGCTAPSITAHPVSATVTLGATTTLAVAATGTTPSYQWYFGASGDTSRVIGGATTSTLPAGMPTTELFWARVSNGCGSVNSNTAIVTTIGGAAGANAVRVRSTATSWRMVGAGDFNADTRPDILVQNANTGALVVWTMMGAGVVSTENFLATQPISVSWRALAVADFNNDTRPDILLQNSTSRTIVVWTMNSNFTVASTENFIGTSSAGWAVVAVGDLNNDNSQDLVLSHAATRQNVVWRLSGFTVTNDSTFLPNTSSGWAIAAVADLSGDGNRDLVLRHAAAGANVVWRMNGYSVVSTEDFLPAAGDSNWRIVGPADWNADGRPDLLWQSSSTNESAIWLLNNYTVIAP